MTAEKWARLKFLLNVSEKESGHLLGTTQRLSVEPIDANWVDRLEANTELAERVDAFVARFGRLQDNLGDKLIPELLIHMLETPGSTLDNLGRMEKLDLLASLLDWTEARNLRHRLVHEYVQDPAEFAGAINRAIALVPLLIETQKRLDNYARTLTDFAI